MTRLKKRVIHITKQQINAGNLARTCFQYRGLWRSLNHLSQTKRLPTGSCASDSFSDPAMIESFCSRINRLSEYLAFQESDSLFVIEDQLLKLFSPVVQVPADKPIALFRVADGWP
ncbi:hypothetical protein OAF09_01030 [bacterium]|nr:hypothetical protein [Rubripirellula sp.]MDB4676790.1 hypothetical protein [bacterium]